MISARLFVKLFTDITYRDFFDPPKQRNFKSKRNDLISPEKTDRSDGTEEDDDGNIMDIMNSGSDEDEEDKGNDRLNNIVRDLFAQDGSDEEDETTKSSFEKKQEKIKKQIEKIEMENIADKDWTLMGEVRHHLRKNQSIGYYYKLQELKIL